MQRLSLPLLICLTLTACALERQPPPAPETVIVFLPAPPEPAAHFVVLEGPAMPASLPPPTHGKTGRPPAPLPPVRIIQQAEKESLIFPTERGYHGGSARQKYVWQPGRLFAVYLSPSAATEIELPLGEQLASGLSLNPEVWEVSNVRVGTELATKDVIKLRPLTDTKQETNVSLLAMSGRSYDLHLIVSKTGQFAVRFELAPMVQQPGDDEGMLPRPPR